MTVALELAERGRGKTSPNPMVGAVIVKNGRVVDTMVGFKPKTEIKNFVERNR